MKTLSSMLIVAGIIVLAGAGCGGGGYASRQTSQTTTPPPAPTLPANYLTYNNQAGWFIAYPNTWQVSKDANGIVYFTAVNSGSTSGLNPYVNILMMANPLKEIPGATLNDAMQQTELALQAGEAKDIRSQIIQLPSGPAIYTAYNYINPSGLQVYAAQVNVFSGNYSYALTYTADAATYEAFQADSNKMFETFVPAP